MACIDVSRLTKANKKTLNKQQERKHSVLSINMLRGESSFSKWSILITYSCPGRHELHNREEKYDWFHFALIQ